MTSPGVDSSARGCAQVIADLASCRCLRAGTGKVVLIHLFPDPNGQEVFDIVLIRFSDSYFPIPADLFCCVSGYITQMCLERLYPKHVGTPVS